MVYAFIFAHGIFPVIRVKSRTRTLMIPKSLKKTQNNLKIPKKLLSNTYYKNVL